MNNRVHPYVLIVDRSDDTREVLQTALARRGHRSRTAATPRQGLETAQEQVPAVIVLDVESLSDGEADLCEGFVVSARAHQGSLVLLGNTAKPRQIATDPENVQLAKPYQYASLVNKIESLLVGIAKSQSSDLPLSGEVEPGRLRNAA